MLKALFNDARLRLDITTTGPLLIKSGFATLIGADMAPVQSYRRNGRQEMYLPGSSLKGVFRSHIEKVVNSIQPQTACNPLSRPNERDARDDRQLYRPSCGGDFKSDTPPHKVYKESCPVCRLFGSTSFGSRIAVEDAYLAPEMLATENGVAKKTLIEHRDGIAIDRLTGGTSGGAKFDLEAVTAETTFTTTLSLRNFEIWQLGMLFVFVQDMQDELIRLGSGRSRGLGKVRGSINNTEEGPYKGGLMLSSARVSKQQEEPANELWGLGHWLGDEAPTYGIRADDALTLNSTIAYDDAPRVRRTRVVKDDAALNSLKDQCIDAFVTRMQTWQSPA